MTKKQPRSGARLLDDVETALRRYVVLQADHDYVAVTLWIAATYALDAFEHAPRLAVISPERRCGKSRLLEMCEYLARNPTKTVNTTVAALVRSIKQRPPTLLVDEADALFSTKQQAANNEDLRAILNAGHQRGGYVLRVNMNAKGQPVEKWPTFAMVALASIKDLPDTIMDRAVVIRMRRRVNGEVVQPFRIRRDSPALQKLAGRLRRWVESVEEWPSQIEDMPVEDRAADTWEPLVMIADAAGGAWGERARLAAKEMVTGEEAIGQSSPSLDLLADVREVWEGKRAMFTQHVLERLWQLEEGRWANFHGRELDAYGLAELLRQYDVRPRAVKIRGQVGKGYRRDELHDAWQRYLPSE